MSAVTGRTGLSQNTLTQTHAAPTEPLSFTPQNEQVHNLSPSPGDAIALGMPQDTTTTRFAQDVTQSHPLPSFMAIRTPTFQWGDEDGEYLTQKVDLCYKEVVHWRRNLFKIPSGKAGTSFVREVSRMLRAYAESSALEGVAMKAAMILPALLLQKPHTRSKTKEHVKHLERRLSLWKEGNLDSLLEEGQTIQSRFTKEYNNQNTSSSEQLLRKFSKLMTEGKVRAALRLIADNNTGQPLRLNSIIDPNTPQKVSVTSY